MAHAVLKSLRRPAGRLWYAVSPHLDSKPDELIAGALAHASRVGRAPICLAASFALTVADVERLAGEEAINGLISKHNPVELRRLKRQLPSANLGGYWEPGLWALPPGVLHVYFIGSWRLITLAMLREVLRRQVLTLTVRCGREWVDIPLDATHKLVALRRGASRAARLFSAPSLRRVVPRLALHDTARRLGARFGPSRRLPGRLVASLLDEGTPQRKPTERARVAVAAPLDASMLMSMIAAAATERRGDFVPGRVVLVCGNLSPGGAERQVAYTARGLAQSAEIAGVELICDILIGDHPARYDFYLPLLRSAGVAAREIERYAFSRAMVSEPAALAQRRASLPEGFLLDVANLYRELIRLRPEVVHAWLDWSNTRAGLAAALAGVPRIVLSGRNVNPTHFELYQPYMDPVYAALCALPNVIFLNNSRAGAASYAEWLRLAPDRIKVIYNGLDMGPVDNTAARAIRSRLGIPVGAPLVGGIFRFYPEKRPLLWVDVASRVLQSNPEAWFVLFGQGILEREIAKAARNLGLAHRLLLPGIVDDVLPVMRALDVFLLTSYGEGVPNVVLEAQWAGTPVVATKAGGVAEALELGESGWIVDPPDADRLARCVGWLLADPSARAQARIAGPELIRTRFGPQRMIDETVQAYDLYRVAIGGSRRGDAASLNAVIGAAASLSRGD
jgi:glycosyltransferase involved in cell wall biosynthesis